MSASRNGASVPVDPRIFRDATLVLRRLGGSLVNLFQDDGSICFAMPHQFVSRCRGMRCIFNSFRDAAPISFAMPRESRDASSIRFEMRVN